MRHDDYVAWAGTSVAVIPMIETTEALGNLDDIMSVPGIDAIYVGPADLSLSLGLKPRNNDGEAGLRRCPRGDRRSAAVATVSCRASTPAERSPASASSRGSG